MKIFLNYLFHEVSDLYALTDVYKHKLKNKYWWKIN